jgi:hypothetical protein
MGRFLLDADQGASLPKFFKIFPDTNARDTIESARRAQHKLRHIKVSSALTSTSAALIVTEKVGAQEERPHSLEDFYLIATPNQICEVAQQVSQQIRQLGDILSESKAESAILWPFHDIQRIQEQWKKFGGQEVMEKATLQTDPLLLYDKLTKSSRRLRLKEQSLSHGDLHISNVALDISEERADAYIFDPGWSSRDVAGRDHAVLEVSTLLHQDIDSNVFAELCHILYPKGGQEDIETKGGGSKIGINVAKFVKEIRRAALEVNDITVYALMILDNAFIQVGGLSYGMSGNMIRNPQSAVYYLAIVADWCVRIRAGVNVTPQQNVATTELHEPPILTGMQSRV